MTPISLHWRHGDRGVRRLDLENTKSSGYLSTLRSWKSHRKSLSSRMALARSRLSRPKIW